MLSLYFAGPTAFNAAPAPVLFPKTHAPAVSMKWGENLGDKQWNHGPDGRASQLTRDHGKLVITLATTGNINTVERNPTLPCSPQVCTAGSIATGSSLDCSRHWHHCFFAFDRLSVDLFSPCSARRWLLPRRSLNHAGDGRPNA